MGARSSKPPPHSIQPEETAVEMFEDPTPDESNNHKWHTTAPALGGSIRNIRISDDNGSEPANKPGDDQEKQKKKRRRSKKEKNKPSEAPPTLVRASTQLNELKKVKPLLQQNPQARQQHFEQIKDAYALDEEAKKAPGGDIRSRFLENWRKTPQTPSDRSDAPSLDTPTLRTRSQAATVPRVLGASSGQSSRGTEEIANDVEEFDEVESLPLPPPTRTSAINSPITAATPSFLAPSNQYEHGRPDVQTTPVIRVKTSDRKTPERSKRSLRSDLRLDDVDEDLMEHILTNDH